MKTIKKEKAIDSEIDQLFDEVLTEEPAKSNVSQMEKLMENSPELDFKEGDKIEGKVIQVDKYAVYVDLGFLGTGVIYGKEIKDGWGDGRKKLKVGDNILSTIVDLENDEGYVELSIREAVEEQAWQDILTKKEKRETVATKVIDVNKGGLMMDVNGIPGFMPVSQLTSEKYPRVEDGDKNKILEILKSYIGTEMKVCVLDAIKDEGKLILSEKEAYRDQEKQAISEFKRGDIIEGEVSGVVDFGAFVKFFPPSKNKSADEKDALEGLVHISQLDWKLIENPRDIIKVGDKVRAKIISIDDTRISLSIRQLKNDPWNEIDNKYKVDDIVKGTVNKINHFGAFVYLDNNIHGLAHVSDFISKFPGKRIDEILEIGKDYYWQIMSLEPREHRMGLKFIGQNAPKKKVKEKAEDKKEGKEAKKATKEAAKKQPTIDSEDKEKEIENKKKSSAKDKKEAKEKKTKKVSKVSSVKKEEK